MVAVHQADGPGFRAHLEHLGGALEFQVLDHRDDVAVREHVAVGVPDDALHRGFVGGGGDFPLVAAGEAFMVRGVRENLGHFTKGAGGLAHAGGGRAAFPSGQANPS